MSALHAVGAPSRPGRGGRRSSQAKPRESTRSGRELATLYISIAAVGIAALSSAGASSLIAGTGGTAGTGGVSPWGPWLAAAAAAAWAAAALAGAVVSFRSANLPRTALTVRAVAAAAAVHLAVLLAGMWRLPETVRSFDMTVAALLVLELSVLAVLGWQHNSSLRVDAPSGGVQATTGARHQPSALAVVGTLFAASILVAAVTTSGLAASSAGALAVPHSGHGAGTPASHLPGNSEQLRNSGHHH